MSDDLIFAFFAVEMLIKMVAMGVAGKGTYLAETWNWLDLFIVLAGYAALTQPSSSINHRRLDCVMSTICFRLNSGVEYCLNMGNMNLSAIRTIRVLRPLRAINRIPSNSF